MSLEIKKYPDPVLRKKAELIKQVGPAIFELIRQMKETLTPEGNEIRGVGLAAPQVGISQRAIVVLINKRLRGFINPTITRESREKVKKVEGCLSFPGLWLEIKRPKWVEIKAIDEEGREIAFKAEGFPAGVFRHEIDHLNGVLFFERLPLWQKLKIKRKLNSQYAAT
ncbi:MAG: peptide deformylase [bacterium]|nr:peptide deformylase [bacterium]